MVERHHQQHGEIDWGAVFDGLSHATGTGNQLAPEAGHGGHGVAPGDAGGETLHNVDPGTVWDHLFPPPQPPPSRLEIGAALASQSANSTPRSVEAGPSRPRGQQRPYPYSASAPLTPNPAYATNGNQDQFFAHLAGSMFLSQQRTGENDPSRDAAGALPSVPLPQGYNSAPLDVDRFGGRKSRQDDPLAWQLPEPSSSTFAFTLPPPHPSLAQHVIPPSRRQSIPVWQTFNAAGPSHHAFTPDRGQSSPEATPLGPPPGTPIQAVSTESSAGSLDTEDKRQRNTLASAKFRAKRKKHITNISKRIGELEGEHSTLTRDVADLRQENRFLREMVELKYGLDVGPGEGDDESPDAPGHHDNGQ